MTIDFGSGNGIVYSVAFENLMGVGMVVEKILYI